MRKRINSLFIGSVLIMALLSGCGNQKDLNATAEKQEVEAEAMSESVQEEEPEAEQPEAQSEEISEASSESAGGSINIVYTNDVHSYINNVIKDDQGNITGDGLRFSKIAAMVNDMRADGSEVILVDAGDEIQGDVYGALDEGATIIDLMNAAGYQVATPGNHDFDYGVISFLKLAETADFPYISCNFHSTKTKEIITKSTQMFEVGGKKIAFVGISTPQTITSSTPTYFQDENGEFLYAVDGMDDPADMYVSVQNAIDSVKDEADYVIALGHLGIGIDAEKKAISSIDVINHVSGLDAFIDGHSHSTVAGELVKDKDGKDVLLTQTGSYLAAVGIMTIGEDGVFSSKLINDYEREDEKVTEIEQKWIEDVNNRLSEKIGVLDTTLYINNPDNNSERLIRAQEMNLGDFTADSIYWFFNERLGIDCDIAIQNGGGIRAQIESGDITYLSAKQVEPFGNMICLISATGQQIIDALENGVGVIGEWDDEWNSPAENGGFMHVAGLSYTIDAGVPSSVEVDSNGMFKSVSGDYRVKDVKVYNRLSGAYEMLEPDKSYQLAGINYILRNSGNGLSMFSDDLLTVDYVGQDYVILAEYIKSFGDGGSIAEVNTKNSPLTKYEGYLLDYENPYGSGRINILNADYEK